MKRITDQIAKEFHDLLNFKGKRTFAQNERIREIWAAMRAKPDGVYTTGNFIYSVVSRKGTRKRAAHKAVNFKMVVHQQNVVPLKKAA